MISNENKLLLQKFFKGGASTEEEKEIYSLFDKYEHDEGFKHFVEKCFIEYVETHPDEKYEIDHVLDKVHHVIHQRENNEKQKLSKRIYRWYARVAAILILPLLIGGFVYTINSDLFNSKIQTETVENTIVAPMGSRINFSLPDGTECWLNSGSTLTYEIPFANNRQIGLNGEGWFNVAHDEAHPFVINSGKSSVEVLGTKFNMNAYPENHYVEVVLEEGKVKFSTTGLSDGVTMKPNERLLLANGEVKINTTEAYKYGAWKEGKLVFRGDLMDDVARRIERWYNVEVVLVDASLKQNVIRGTFKDDSLEEVLHYLSLTTPIKYKIIDKEMTEDETISKKKVLIYCKK